MKKILFFITFLVIANVHAGQYENATIIKFEAHPTRGMGVKFKIPNDNNYYWAYLDVITTDSSVYNTWVSLMLMAYAVKQKVDIYSSQTADGYDAITVFEVKDASDTSIH